MEQRKVWTGVRWRRFHRGMGCLDRRGRVKDGKTVLRGGAAAIVVQGRRVDTIEKAFFFSIVLLF